MAKCQFLIRKFEDGKEVTYICPEDATAITRTLDVCDAHFKKLVQDNKHRVWYENGKLVENIDEEDETEDDRIDNSVDNINDTFIPSDCSLEIKDKRILGRLVKQDGI
jgi:hypothetical protein